VQLNRAASSAQVFRQGNKCSSVQLQKLILSGNLHQVPLFVRQETGKRELKWRVSNKDSLSLSPVHCVLLFVCVCIFSIQQYSRPDQSPIEVDLANKELQPSTEVCNVRPRKFALPKLPRQFSVVPRLLTDRRPSRRKFRCDKQSYQSVVRTVIPKRGADRSLLLD